MKAVHRAYAESGFDAGGGPNSRQLAAFVRRLGIRVRGDGDNDMSVMLPNGSRIVGLPGVEATMRGYSAVGLPSCRRRKRGRVHTEPSAGSGSFLYQHVLEQPLDRIEGVVRARKPKRLPVVLSRDEAQAILTELDGGPRLVYALLHGLG